MSTRRKLPTVYRARLPISVGIGSGALDTKLLRAIHEFERMFGRPPTRLRYPVKGGWSARTATVAAQSAMKKIEDDGLGAGMLILEADRRTRKRPSVTRELESALHPRGAERREAPAREQDRQRRAG